MDREVKKHNVRKQESQLYFWEGCGMEVCPEAGKRVDNRAHRFKNSHALNIYLKRWFEYILALNIFGNQSDNYKALSWRSRETSLINKYYAMHRNYSQRDFVLAVYLDRMTLYFILLHYTISNYRQK